jgi:hypothetical protein
MRKFFKSMRGYGCRFWDYFPDGAYCEKHQKYVRDLNCRECKNYEAA